jgi:hypothetical protein
LLRRTLGEAVALETVLASGLWRTFADSNQIKNAVLNLALNARDAMPNGGKLTIETANYYLDEAYVGEIAEPVMQGQYVMVAVTDTGFGICGACRSDGPQCCQRSVRPDQVGGLLIYAPDPQLVQRCLT